MKILINGQEAVLKADASFEYVSENPLFTEAEDYSLEITFPMKDCPKNILIFGPLHVDGVDISKISFACEIQDTHFAKSGILTITSVSETEVQGQFLEGMSQENFTSSLPDVYLTDLDFSQYDGTKGGWENYENSPEFGWEEMTVYDTEKEDYFDTHNIYLAHLIELIARVTGWQVNMDALNSIPMFRQILVVNARRPKKWENPVEYVRSLNLSLPHWTIKEFFRQIELFFGVVCHISSLDRTVTFKKCSSMMNPSGAVKLDVCDDFTVELSTEKTSYRGSTGVKLPSECNPNNINSCPNIMDLPRYSESIRHLTSDELLYAIYYARDGNFSYIGDDSEEWFGLDPCFLFYLTDLKRYAVVTKTDDVQWDTGSDKPFRRIQQAEIINQFGFLGEGTELKISPCPISTGIGFYLDYSYPKPQLAIPMDPEEIIIPYYSREDKYFNNTAMTEYLAAGIIDKEDMYYDKLWLVLCEERNLHEGGDEPEKFIYTRKYETFLRKSGFNTEGDEPVSLDYTARIVENPYTLIPSDPTIQSVAALPSVDETKLYRYKFLAQTLPAPTNIFLINGKKFACLRLTAHFTVNGMSQLVEGEFYEIID